MQNEVDSKKIRVFTVEINRAGISVVFPERKSQRDHTLTVATWEDFTARGIEAGRPDGG